MVVASGENVDGPDGSVNGPRVAAVRLRPGYCGVTTPLAGRSGYWGATRAPRYSILFALPLLILYEVLAAFLTRTAAVHVRNGADVLLKSLFVAVGGLDGLAVFGLVLFGTGAILVWRDLSRHGWRLRARVFAGMLAESVLYALLLGTVAGLLTAVVLGGVPVLALVAPGEAAAAVQAAAAPGRMDLATQLMISLGAGLYEELLFRVILVTGLLLLAQKVFRWRTAPATAFAVVTGAVIFSAFHYIGPYGDPLEAGSFTFRLIAGLLFSGLYVLRGFGITAWSHALYDVFLTI